MEYYYCPGLLKLLRCLWVSALSGRRAGRDSPPPPRILPTLLSGSSGQRCLCFLCETVVVSRKRGRWERDGGLVWEAEGVRRAGNPGCPGPVGTAAPSPVLGKARKTWSALVSFPENDIPLIFRTLLYSEIISLPLCTWKNVLSFLR